MPGRPFRFIHASDLHLEMPPQGVIEVPDHLRGAFIEAAYSAAQRVFDAAMAEEAEFLVLSGDILNPQRTGLRGPLFLTEQFARLAKQGIAVYWAGGDVDPPEAWPSAFLLPSNVHVFPRSRAIELVHERDGAPLARLVGMSRGDHQPLRADDFVPDPAGLFSIAVVHGTADAATLQARGIHYWALGGLHDRSTLFSSPTIAHYPGSPQGRLPEELGPHGCTVVQVDDRGQARTTPVPTDAVRWLSEEISVDEIADRDNIETLFRERVRTLIETAPGRDLLISWTITGSNPAVAQLRHAAIRGELLGWLRSEYGFSSPAAWGVSLEPASAMDLPASLFEQETILGDFLRAARQDEMNEDEPLNLETYLAESHLAGELSSAAATVDKAVRQRVLREAALLGADLLSGGDPFSPGEPRT